MPDLPSMLRLADDVLLGAGVLGIIAIIASLLKNRKMGTAIALPACPPNRLEPADLVIAFFVTLYLPALLPSLFANPLAAPTQPTTTQPVTATAAQLFASSIGLILSIAVMIRIGARRFEGGIRGWGLVGDGIGRRVFQAVLAYILITPVCFALLEAVTWLLGLFNYTPETHGSIRTMQDHALPPLVRGLTIVNALALASVSEEMLFRGILLPALVRWTQSPWLAIAITSVFFGMIHYPYVDTIIPLAAFSCLLGFLYLRTGSLTLVTLLHAVFNGKTLLWLMLGATP